MSSAQDSYPAFTHLACSEANPVSGKEPPILMGSPVGVEGFAGWQRTGDAINTTAKEMIRLVIMLFFI
jgi:hypothetical protein